MQKAPGRLRLIGWAVLAWVWFAIADALSGRAARGLTNRFNADLIRPLLTVLFLLFLIIVGYALFEVLGSREPLSFRRTANLTRRSTSGREWALGATIGWAMAIFCILPMAFGHSFHVRLWMEPRAFLLLAANVATLIVSALAAEIGLRGYPFRCLVKAVGPGVATALLAAALGAAHWFSPESTSTSVIITMIFTILLCLAWLRTHALWLGWGLHSAWSLAVAVVFGLPLRGDISFASVVQTRAVRPAWLTGDAFGPEGAVLAAVALLIAIVVLVQSTDDYAWAYTRPEIVAAGYAVDPPPPAAHVAMTQEPEAGTGSLVQILPTTPRSSPVNLP